jgi:aspartate 1-decarboxylase
VDNQAAWIVRDRDGTYSERLACGEPLRAIVPFRVGGKAFVLSATEVAVRTVLKSKIHRATVTQADLHYEGSITIDRALMEAADILPYEQVHVLDVNNGNRLTTYAIEGDRDSGQICINGAAAHLVDPGDIVIILTYKSATEAEASNARPQLVYVDERNRIARIGHSIEAVPPVAVA